MDLLESSLPQSKPVRYPPIDASTISASDRRRFESKLKRNDATGCLEFTGYRHFDGGHGMFWFKGRMVWAHRFAYALSGRKMPAGHDEVMHHCPCGDNPACCEEAHLGTGTPAEHARDRSRKGQVPKSRSGLPFGVRRQQNGRYQATVNIAGKVRGFGTFDTLQEAAAVAFRVRIDRELRS